MPDATYHRIPGLPLMVVVMVLLLATLFRFYLSSRYAFYVVLLPTWLLSFVSYAVQWILSVRDSPRKTSAGEDHRLARLRVVVNVPVYNEDPALLDRCLYSLVNQHRPVQRVDVVDDGSGEDYSRLREHWERGWPNGCEVTWLRQENAGKKVAQSRTFVDDPEADVFITVDSDTALDYRAVEEGLKPFADRTVASVAGIELVGNQASKWLNDGSVLAEHPLSARHLGRPVRSGRHADESRPVRALPGMDYP